MNKTIKQIRKIILKAKNIAIFSHVSPDFDALGSSFALQLFLISINKNATFFTNDELTLKEKMLFGEYLIGKAFKIEDFDLVISVDTPSIQMLGIYGEDFMKHSNRIVIDHHQNNGLIGTVTFVDPSYSSCCEIVYQILKSFKKKLSKEQFIELLRTVKEATSVQGGHYSQIKVHENEKEITGYRDTTVYLVARPYTKYAR